jgi:hypothetical protein
MNFIDKITIFLLLLSFQVAHSAELNHIDEKLNVYISKLNVEFNVFGVYYENNPIISRKLQITATGATGSVHTYEEDNVEPPLGVFLLADGIPRIYSTWATGSAYLVKVYGISGQKIEKLFERGSRTLPQAGLDEQGHEIITVSDAVWGNGTRHIQYHKYIWDRNNYIDYKYLYRERQN